MEVSSWRYPHCDITMESSPIEIIECVAAYLSSKDAKNLSLVSWLYYRGSLNRIWNYARLFKSPNLHLPTKFLHEIAHFPIKRLYTGDLINHHSFEIENLPKTIQELYVDDLILSEKSLNRFKNLSIKVYLFTDIIKDSYCSVPNIYDILGTFNNLKVLTGISSRYNNDTITKGLHIYDLKDLRTLHFSELSTDQFSDIWEFEKKILIDILVETRIDTFHIPRINSNCQNLTFSREDIKRMRTLNIDEICTEVLENTFTTIHPWPEMQELKTLQRLIISPGTFLNLRYLQQHLKFNAVKIGDSGSKFPVSEIETLRNYIVHETGTPHISFSFSGTDWDIWTFLLYTDITIYLSS